MRPPVSLRDRAAGIRLLALDADGVLTDGRIFIADASGSEWTTGFSVRDGYGIRAAMRVGIEVAVISGRDSYGLRLRLSELGIRHFSLRCRDKQAALSSLLGELALRPDQAAFVGDDVVDLPAMRLAGLAVAVADAHTEVRDEADWVTSLPGGHGAVREVCDFMLAAQS
ncbi:MAG: HAD hydrolase family protein [Gammaproteobacteria bacterium]|nr:HAD hydrolase family protein [Gammaproteobacteria bacterium]MXW20389.1 HAD hydrolase family protein [Gammaproteobacteria bacterium]MYH32843.1 HAD hydrolase family protein [Gammaproteobacteria bacterium]MYL02331.1 HAD hydrolase family protein [Gammaproteobacteria bacterium]